MSRRSMQVAGAGWFLLCAATSWMVVIAVMAEPGPAPDHTEELNEILKSVLPDGSDATPLLIEFNARWDELSHHWEMESGEVVWTWDLLHLLQVSEWSDPELSLAHEAWRQISPLLSLLHDAAEHTAVRASYVKIDGEAAPGNEQRFTRLTGPARELLRIAIRDAAEREAWDEVEQNLETALRLAHLFGQRPSLGDGMTASRLVGSPLVEIALLSQEQRIPHDVCERLIDVIHGVDPLPAPIERVFDVERLRTNIELSRLFSRSGIMIYWMEGIISPEASLTERLTNVRALATHRRDLAESAIEEQFRALAAWSDENPEDRPSHLDGLVHAGPVGNGIWDYLLWSNESLFMYNFIVRQSLRAGARAALRLAAYRDLHGHWPETLDEAVSDEELLDPVTGEPLQYTRVNESEYGEPYRLVTPPQPETLWPLAIPTPVQRANVIDFAKPRGSL